MTFTPERHLPTPEQHGHSPQRHIAGGEGAGDGGNGDKGGGEGASTAAPSTTDAGNTVPQLFFPGSAHPPTTLSRFTTQLNCPRVLMRRSSF